MDPVSLSDRPDFPSYVVEHSNVSNVAWHCYSGTSGWDVLTQFHNDHPNVDQWMTECWLHLNSGENFFDLPDFFGGPLSNWARGVMAWTIGGSVDYDVAYQDGCAQCSGIIQVNRTSRTYEKTQDFYTLGQFSRFVHRGAHAINVTAGEHVYPDGTGVEVNAFINPNGKRIVVIRNMINAPLIVEVNFASGDAYVGEIKKRSVASWIL